MAPASISLLEGPALRLARLLEAEDEAFVRDAYRCILGREPDPQGFQDYLEQLAAGASRMGLLAALASSGEGRARGCADRGVGELVVAYVNRREAVPASLEALLELADTEFVMGAYRAVLGRDVDPAGLAYYARRVRAGEPKVDILASLRSSEEGRQREAALRNGGAGRVPILAEIDRAASVQAWARLPLIGAGIAALFGLESYSPTARRMRRLENLAARSAAALGLGIVDAPPERDAPAQALHEKAAGGERDTGIHVSAGNKLGDRLLTLPRVFGPGEARRHT